MKLDYFSTEEDLAFSDMVISYNQMKEDGKDDESLHSFIVDRINILIYLIPIRNLFLDYDEATDIYMELNDNIEKIISSYRVSTSSFNSYLTQVCRYKALSIAVKNRKEQQLVQDSWYYDHIELEDNYAVDEVLCENESYYGTPRPEVRLMDLSLLCKFIIDNCDGRCMKLEEKERKLKCALKDKKNRKALLVFLLSIPCSPSAYLVSELAKVLDLDSLVIARLFELKYDALSDKHSRNEEEYKKGIKHWKIMMQLTRAINLECDDIVRQGLMERYEKTAFCHAKRMRKASKAKGMTQSEIASALKVHRSSITKQMQSAKRMLSIILYNEVAPNGSEEL